MSEFPLKHSGVTARFTTGSVNTGSSNVITGIPYCLIGTSVSGPAFVPLSFGNKEKFSQIHGDLVSDHLAQVTTDELLNLEQDVTFVRILGTGDGKPRNLDGTVTNAGFIVGENQIQNNVVIDTRPTINNNQQMDEIVETNTLLERSLGNNKFSHSPINTAEASNSHGRTYILGCFLKPYIISRVAGGGLFDLPDNSKINTFTRSGIDMSKKSAPIIRAVIMAASGVSLSVSSSIENTHNEPIDQGVTGIFGIGKDAGHQIGNVDKGPGGALQEFCLFQNGHKDASKRKLNLSFDKTNDRFFASILNRDPDRLEEEGHYLYTSYDDVYFSDAVVDNAYTNATPKAPEVQGDQELQGIEDGEYSVFCLRTNSGIGAQAQQKVLIAHDDGLNGETIIITIPANIHGQGIPAQATPITIKIKTVEAVIEDLDGLTNTIVVSIAGLQGVALARIEIAQRIKEVLNRKLDDQGNPDFLHHVHNLPAELTSSESLIKGIIAEHDPAVDTVNLILKALGNGIYGNSILIETSDESKIAAQGSTFEGGIDNQPGSSGTTSTEDYLGIPNFEKFRNRYTHPKTPFFVSQTVNGRVYDLFRLHAVSDGEHKEPIVATIKQISPSASSFQNRIENTSDRQVNVDLYGTFSLEISGSIIGDPILADNLSLDPSSPDFISRRIGDVHLYHNLDSSEKTVVAGKYPAFSNDPQTFGKIRVEVNPAIERKEIPPECLPFGFRGMPHLATAGNTDANSNGIFYLQDDCPAVIKNMLNSVTEPPFPLRDRIWVDLNSEPSVTNVSWGAATQVLGTNKNLFNNMSFTRYFPDFNTNIQNPWIVDNTSKTILGGKEINNDKFNNNGFSLEKILVPCNADEDGVKSILGTFTDGDITNPRDLPGYFWKAARYIRDGIDDGGILLNYPNKDDTRFNLSAGNSTKFLELKDLLNTGVQTLAKFSCLFYGGFDGLNIFDKQKRNMTNLALYDEQSELSHNKHLGGPTFNAYRTALDIVKDKSFSDFDVLLVPSITNRKICQEILDLVEDRFDCVYIMDLEKLDQAGNILDPEIQQIIQDRYDEIALSNLNEFTTIVPNTVPLYSDDKTLENFRDISEDSSFCSVFFPGARYNKEFGGVTENIAIPGSSCAAMVLANTQKEKSLAVATTGKTNGSLPLELAERSIVIGPDIERSRYSSLGINLFLPSESGSGIHLSEAKTLILNTLGNNSGRDSNLYYLAHRRSIIHFRRAVRNASMRTLFQENSKTNTTKLLRTRINALGSLMVENDIIDSYSIVFPHPGESTGLINIADAATSSPSIIYGTGNQLVRGLINIKLRSSNIEEEIEAEADDDNPNA